MGEPMEVIDLLSSDEEGEVPNPTNQDGFAAAGPSVLNQVKLEKVNQEPGVGSAEAVTNNDASKGHVHKEGVDPVSNIDTIERLKASEEMDTPGDNFVRKESAGDVQGMFVCKPGTQSEPVNAHPGSEQPAALTDSDDDIEFVEEVKVQQKDILKNTKLVGDSKYYKNLTLNFSKDPRTMMKVVIEMMKKTDSRYCCTIEEIKEFKARQHYRAKEIEELQSRYKMLQNDVYRLGNPLDMETQCGDDAYWDPIAEEIKPSGHVLREVKCSDIAPAAKIPSAKTRVSDIATKGMAELSDDDDVVELEQEPITDVQTLATGNPVVYELNAQAEVLVAEDPKSLTCTWSQAQILEKKLYMKKPYYNVTFTTKQTLPNATIAKEFIVVNKVQPVKFPVKMRVVAGFRTSPDSKIAAKYLAGFIGELPIALNNFRYLVLFDTGDASYVPHEDIFAHFDVNFNQVLPQLKMIPETAKQAIFLEKYFETYPDRLLVIPAIDEKMRVMVNEFWYSAKVITSRQSLMQVRIKRLKLFKWIFRGSYHLKPIFDCLFPNQRIQKAPKVHLRAINPSSTRVAKSSRGRVQRNHFVERRNAEIMIESDSDESTASNYSNSSASSLRRFDRRPSKKHPQRTVLEKLLNNPNFPLNFIINESLEAPHWEQVPIYKFHYCSNRCLNSKEYVPENFRDTNPFSVPLILGWTRVVRTVDRGDVPDVICYKPPCGRSLINMTQLVTFLKKSKSDLPISLFTFEPSLEVWTDEQSIGCYYMDEDLSNGLEQKSISVVNQYDTDRPKPFKYQTRPTFSPKLANEKAVALDNDMFFDQSFNSCCSCSNQCQDAEKCECQQLTFNQCKVKYPKQSEDWAFGYDFKLSMKYIDTGIFECNSGCSCNQTRCFNRVASLGVQHRLQLFKTAKKGWGVRALHDIPPGSFVCAYMARILTPEEGNDDSNTDIYFADLDLLGRLEQLKLDTLLQPEDYISSGDDSSDDDRNWRYDNGDTNCIPSRKKDETSGGNRKRIVGDLFRIQEYLGDDCAFVMDANEEGNIGRYFNHSCDPNAYVQNVFIHTHDPRFPMIALFTVRLVKAFEEITWDYGYTPGSVPGRELMCECGTRKCRKRLL